MRSTPAPSAWAARHPLAAIVIPERVFRLDPRWYLALAHEASTSLVRVPEREGLSENELVMPVATRN